MCTCYISSPGPPTPREVGAALVNLTTHFEGCETYKVSTRAAILVSIEILCSPSFAFVARQWCVFSRFARWGPFRSQHNGKKPNDALTDCNMGWHCSTGL